jgi:hypothetical protein
MARVCDLPALPDGRDISQHFGLFADLQKTRRRILADDRFHPARRADGNTKSSGIGRLRAGYPQQAGTPSMARQLPSNFFIKQAKEHCYGDE